MSSKTAERADFSTILITKLMTPPRTQGCVHYCRTALVSSALDLLLGGFLIMSWILLRLFLLSSIYSTGACDLHEVKANPKRRNQ